MSRERGGPVRGHVTLTGGEPFVRRDIEGLLEHVVREYTFAVLTNGTLIDADRARRLAKWRPAFVQVSMEGTEATHDRIRGQGSFQRSVTAIEHLVHAGIRTLISFTAHAGNYREFSDVVALGCRLKVSRVWADRLVPWGGGAELPVLSPGQTREFLGIMRRARDAARRRWFCRTEVAMHRALQFLENSGIPYHCTAGDTLLTIMPTSPGPVFCDGHRDRTGFATEGHRSRG